MKGAKLQEKSPQGARDENGMKILK